MKENLPSTNPEEVTPEIIIPKPLDPKNMGGLTKEEWDETQRWFELEGKIDTLHLGS